MGCRFALAVTPVVIMLVGHGFMSFFSLQDPKRTDGETLRDPFVLYLTLALLPAAGALAILIARFVRHQRVTWWWLLASWGFLLADLAALCVLAIATLPLGE